MLFVIHIKNDIKSKANNLRFRCYPYTKFRDNSITGLDKFDIQTNNEIGIKLHYISDIFS